MDVLVYLFFFLFVSFIFVDGMNLEIIYYSLFIIRLCWTFFFFLKFQRHRVVCHTIRMPSSKIGERVTTTSWVDCYKLLFISSLIYLFLLAPTGAACLFFSWLSRRIRTDINLLHTLCRHLFFRRFRPFRPFNTFEQLSTFEKKKRKYLFIINWAGLDYCRDWRLIYWHLKRSSLLGTHGMFARVFSSPSPSLFDQTDTHM